MAVENDDDVVVNQDLSPEEQEELEGALPEQQEAVEDHQDDPNDQELADAETDAEREAIRQRRREERRQKKEYRKNKEDSYKREIEALRSQLQEVNAWKNSVEQRQMNTGIHQLEKAIQDSSDTLNLAKQAIAEATKSQDGDALVEAQELYYAARKRLEDLSQFKNKVVQQINQPRRPPADPAVVGAAQAWLQDKPWYDPAGGNLDSRIAIEVDADLANEGWNPKTPEYWTELNRRLQKHLPHRFANSGSMGYTSSNGEQQSGRPPTSGSGQGHSPRASGFKLSAERVRALKEAGMWDDPEARKRMIKRYMEMDKASGNKE